MEKMPYKVGDWIVVTDSEAAHIGGWAKGSAYRVLKVDYDRVHFDIEHKLKKYNAEKCHYAMFEGIRHITPLELELL